MPDELMSHRHSYWCGQAQAVHRICTWPDAELTRTDLPDLRQNAHYRLFWSGWLDNGPNTADNYFYLAFGNADGVDVTAGHYAEARTRFGHDAYNETGINPANVGIQFARTVYYRDTYFSFCIDFFTGNNIAFPATAQLQMVGNARDSANRVGTLLGSGCLREGFGIRNIDRIRIGITLTSPGYVARSWIKMFLFRGMSE